MEAQNNIQGTFTKTVKDIWTAFKISMFFLGLFFAFIQFQVKVMGHDVRIGGGE